ncbi:hypothetical protein [Micromonospora profundi]|uniref:hypothetical protein n=1 Tax=Micromonospora profundi TaxID=1420889 RepID=UPI0036510A72
MGFPHGGSPCGSRRYHDLAGIASIELIGQDTSRIPVTDSPRIESVECNVDNEPIAGTTGPITLKPCGADVVARE